MNISPPNDDSSIEAQTGDYTTPFTPNLQKTRNIRTFIPKMLETLNLRSLQLLDLQYHQFDSADR